jgi:RNA polymerase sigma-70 factor, ECF subfamily
MAAAAEVAAGRLAGPGWADRDISAVGAVHRAGDRAGSETMDEEAFDVFYEASFGRLVGQIYAMCGNMAEAQDCVQEAFIRAWDRRRSLDLDQSPEAWVRTVAYRLAVSRWRRARKSLLPPDRAHAPAPPAEPDVHRVALARALQALPADQRRAIVLYHLCDLSVAEVAAEVNAPTGTVKARLSRGRAALATLLGDSEEARRG